MESDRQSKKQPKKVKTHDVTEMSTSETSSFPKTNKIIYFQPFPRLLTRQEYDKFAGPKSRKNINYNGFSITRDERDKTYEDYVKDFDNLLIYIEKQKEEFYASFAKVKQDLTIEVYTLPKNQEELEELQNKFKEMNPADVFLISAHGNENVIGISAFAMDYKQLYKALTKLNMPDPSPYLVIWACNSATQKKDEPTIIDKLQEAMKESGMISANVSGLKGFLQTALTTKNPHQIIYASKNVKSKNPSTGSPAIVRKKLNNEDYMRYAGTPDSKAAMEKLDKRRISMGQQIREGAQTRAAILAAKLEEKAKKELETKKVEPEQVAQSPEDSAQQTPKKPGRQKKIRPQAENTTPVKAAIVQNNIEPEITVQPSEEVVVQTPRRRGRPKKQQEQIEVTAPVQTDIVQSDSANVTRLAEEASEQQSPKRRGRPKKQQEQVEVTTPVQTDIGQVVSNTKQTTNAPRTSARIMERNQRLQAEGKNNTASVQNNLNQGETTAPSQITSVRRAPARMIAPNSRLFNLGRTANSNSVATRNQNVANDGPNQDPKKEERTHRMTLRSGKKQ